MGECFSCNKPNVEITDYTPRRKRFDYLRANGTISYTIDRTYDVPEMETNFDDWYKASVRLWPKFTKMTSNILGVQRTPLPSPTISTSSSDSGINTVF